VTHGQFRDGFPRIVLDLTLRDGTRRSVEFIVDSGFEADLTLPPDLLIGLDADYAGEYPFSLADLTYRTRPVYRIILNWQGEDRVTEVVAMDGNALLGVGVLRNNLVQMEMVEGGEIVVEPM
jgi:predicted aspartyl protease